MIKIKAICLSIYFLFYSFSAWGITIGIDAGHGGKDPGAIGINGVYEKDINKKVALKVYKALSTNANIKAILVRENDEFINAKDRLEKIKGLDLDILVSLHADYINNKKVKGASVFILSNFGFKREWGTIAKNHRFFSDENYDFVDIKEEYFILSKEMKENMIMKDKVSKELAKIVLKNFNKGGIKLLYNKPAYESLIVLKPLSIPSILIELGFLSNPDEIRLLQDDKHINKLVDLIVKSLYEFIQSKQKK